MDMTCDFCGMSEKVSARGLCEVCDISDAPPPPPPPPRKARASPYQRRKKQQTEFSPTESDRQTYIQQEGEKAVQEKEAEMPKEVPQSIVWASLGDRDYWMCPISNVLQGYTESSFDIPGYFEIARLFFPDNRELDYQKNSIDGSEPDRMMGAIYRAIHRHAEHTKQEALAVLLLMLHPHIERAKANQVQAYRERAQKLITIWDRTDRWLKEHFTSFQDSHILERAKKPPLCVFGFKRTGLYK